MQKLRASGLAVGLLCALLIGGACSGGGGGADDGGSSPPPPPPSGGSPPPPPPTGQPAPSEPGVTRPALYIEQDSDGAKYLRVLEQVFDAFAPGQPQRIIADRNQNGGSILIEGAQTTLVTNVNVTNGKHGLTLQDSATVSIYNYTYQRWQDNSAHGAAIKIGDNGNATVGPTYIQRVFGDAELAPDPGYNINIDFLGIEGESEPIYVRDVTGRNVSDGGIDTKSDVYVMNATLDGAGRVVRAWMNDEIVLANSIINVDDDPDFAQAWIHGGEVAGDEPGLIRYYNTLWCVGAAEPSASNPACTADPTRIEDDDVPDSVLPTRFVRLTENPLPAVSNFFFTAMDEIVVEYSSDAGATWQVLALPNTGGPGSPPVGDPRYRIPLNLAAADYRFRAFYRKNGAKVGDTSEVIDETGQVR